MTDGLVDHRRPGLRTVGARLAGRIRAGGARRSWGDYLQHVGQVVADLADLADMGMDLSVDHRHRTVALRPVAGDAFRQGVW